MQWMRWRGCHADRTASAQALGLLVPCRQTGVFPGDDNRAVWTAPGWEPKRLVHAVGRIVDTLNGKPAEDASTVT